MKEFKGKVAVHSITWEQEHLKAMEEASQLGYRAIEPWASYVLTFAGRESELQHLLASHGLTMCGLYGGAAGGYERKFSNAARREEIIDYNVALAKVMNKCGAEHLILGPGAPRNHPTTLEELKSAAVTINETAKRTLELGVKSCLHPHLWTEVQDENELDTLMELCDSEAVFFAPDTAHLTGAGMNVPEIIRRYKDRIAYVHLKDLTAEDATLEDFPMMMGNEALPVFCELGLGRIDFHPILAALKEIEYDGWLTVEIDTSTSTPYRSLEICRDFVQDQLNIKV